MREGHQQEAAPIAWRSLCLIVVATIIVSLIALFYFDDGSEELRPATMRAWLQDTGAWGGLLFVAAYSCLQPLGVRAVLFLLSAPLIWEPIDAFLLSWTGAMGTAVVSFVIARFVARDWVQRRMPDSLRRFDDRLCTHGFRTVLLLRVMFYTTPALQYALGVSRVAFRPFLVGTMLGIVPFTLAMTLAGLKVSTWLEQHPIATWPWAELGPLIVVLAAVLVAGVGLGIGAMRGEGSYDAR
ncbi:MAG: VTT domain-containing protein [Myxococcales bacterium]|nr:VTT domain-containing protein [Myxococcales bacterium]MDH3484451.1 VTT domain-containing protein [Myxococcales bacterium]